MRSTGSDRKRGVSFMAVSMNSTWGRQAFKYRMLPMSPNRLAYSGNRISIFILPHLLSVYPPDKLLPGTPGVSHGEHRVEDIHLVHLIQIY